MKRYKLKKELPTFKVGDEFYLNARGKLIQAKTGIIAYAGSTLYKFPNILQDWFEEIPERPKTVWDLKEGDECWTIICCELGYNSYKLKFGELAIVLRETGDLYLTKAEAEEALEKQEAEVILRRDTKGFKPDWNDANQVKYRVFYHGETGRLEKESARLSQYGGIHFASFQDANASIMAHEKEWKIFLGVEEQDGD